MPGGDELRAGESTQAGAGRRMLSRRQVLTMGVSTAVGVALGLWSCQPAETGRVAATGNATTRGLGVAASTQANLAGAETVPASQVATAAETGPAVAAAPETLPAATASAPATRAAIADLGNVVFPKYPNVTAAMAELRDAPVIVIPRGDWAKAGPRLADIVPMEGVGKITVHHSGAAFETDAWRPTAGSLEGIREFHAGDRPTDRHWADIAYHFAIDRAGRVWQARPLAYQGAHVKGHNEHNLGIVLLGNFEVQSPSAAQLTSLGGFIGFVRKIYEVPAGEVRTHGELGDTECPGKQLQGFMDRMRKG